jgi:hypothetical protein
MGKGKQRMKIKNQKGKGARTTVVVACVLLGLAWLPVLGFASPALLPPLTTLTPYPTGQATPVYTVTPPPPPAASAMEGATIELRAVFPATWPWETSGWREVWTVLQWQDEKGRWHDVEGWRGELEEVEIDTAGQAVGLRSWWVADEDLGTGPFRWTVYQSQGGKLLGMSEPFNLPETIGQKVVVVVSLSQAWR